VVPDFVGVAGAAAAGCGADPPEEPKNHEDHPAGFSVILDSKINEQKMSK
jgi:hypothetical protein